MFFSNKLNEYGFLKHAFFDRNNGVSKTLLDQDFASLNVGLNTGDALENIQQNRQIIANYFNQPYENLLTLKQSHTNKVVVVNENSIFSETSKIEADALITQSKNKILSVVHADCSPVLIVDTNNKIIASIHSGWKGAFLGIIANTLQKMAELATLTPNFIVAIGPTIAQNNYEVDDIFYNQFISQDSSNINFFINKQNGKYLFNLPFFIEQSLILNGVDSKNIENLNLDTYSNEYNFFSHRRSVHKGFKSRGLQMSAIMLT